MAKTKLYTYTFYILLLLLQQHVLVISTTYDQNCSLDIQQPSIDCGSGTWGGFLDENCCGASFDEYLYALANRANRTNPKTSLFLSLNEQKYCLTLTKRIENDVSRCGVERISRRIGGCSDYSVEDVEMKLAKRLKLLGEDCESFESRGCGGCLRRWQEIDGWSDNVKASSSMEGEVDVCRFSVLVSLMSRRSGDESWVHGVFGCLKEQSFGQVGFAEEKGNAASTQFSTRTGLYIMFGGLVGILLIIAIAVWILYTKNNKDDYSPSTKKHATTYQSFSNNSTCANISRREVYSATNNLSPSNYIGQGIAGKVYKGILSNGRHVAVKHIINDGEAETFAREVRSLSHVTHSNLVTLIGYYEKEDESFLVYELCHHGNLSEWLYGKEKVLSWVQRLKIAIDSARALWFLHTYPEGCIVHRDIKPTNILITASFEAKLSDFGLSKVMDIGQSYVSSEVRGTFGYVDPEYRRNHHVNASGDVYSFGIVLLQLISGQRVINLNSNQPMPLHKMAKVLTRGGDITDFADARLNGEYSTEAFDLVLKLALSCAGLKRERPSMEQVVSRLEKALDISIRVKSFTHSLDSNYH